jgi:sigma-E factor negative regulatory protein RseB
MNTVFRHLNSIKPLTFVAVLFFSGLVSAQEPVQNPPAQAESATQSEPSEASTSQQAPAVSSSAKLSGGEWLLKMSQAITELNYVVSMVQSHGGSDTTPYLWRHGVFDKGVSMEHLSVLNGPGKEYIRVNRVISVFEPDVRPYSLSGSLIDGPFPTELLTDPLNLQTAYDFIAVGRSRVSGRAAQQIRIISRDNSRYAYQLWLDEESGMPLKLNMLDLGGKVLEQIQVTQMSLSATPDPYFDRINHDVLPAVTKIPNRHHQHNWNIVYLPVGMIEVKRNTHRLADTGQVVEYAMLSDGLVSVSVYVMPVSAPGLQNNAYRHESKTVLTRIEGNLQITVIGEVPPQTANQIAASLSARVN